MASYISSMSALIGANTDPFKAAIAGLTAYADTAAKGVEKALTKTSPTALTTGLVAYKNAVLSMGKSVSGAVEKPLLTAQVALDKFGRVGTGALFALSAGAAGLAEKLKAMRDADFGGRMAAGFRSFLGALRDRIDLRGAWDAAGAGLKAFASRASGTLKAIDVSAAWGGAASGWAALWDRFRAAPASAWASVAAGARSAGSAVAGAFRDPLGTVRATFAATLSGLSAGWAGLKSAFFGGLGGGSNLLLGGLSSGLSLLSTGLKGAAAAFGALTSVGGFGLHVFGELLGVVDGVGKSIKGYGDAAMRAGVPLADFRKVVAGVGVAADDLGTAEKLVFKFNLNLANAAVSAKGAKNAFADLGLDAEKLAKGGTADAFRAVFGELEKIRNPALRAKAAFDVFGKSATAVMPALARGVAGFDKAVGKLGRFGLDITDADLASIRELDKAKKDFGLIGEGLKTQFTLGVAPLLAGAAKWIQSLNAVELKGLKDTFFNVGVFLIRTGANVIAVFSDLSLMTEAWKLFADNVSLYFVKSMTKAMKSLVPSAKSIMGEDAAKGIGGVALASFAGYMDSFGADGKDGTGKTDLDRRNEAFAKRLKANPAVAEAEKAIAEMRRIRDGVSRPAEDADPFRFVRPRIDELRKDLVAPLDAFGDKLGEIMALRNSFVGPRAGEEVAKAFNRVNAFADSYLDKIPRSFEAAAGKLDRPVRGLMLTFAQARAKAAGKEAAELGEGLARLAKLATQGVTATFQAIAPAAAFAPPVVPKFTDEGVKESVEAWKKLFDAGAGALGIKARLDIDHIRKQWESANLGGGAFDIAPGLDAMSAAKAFRQLQATVKLPERKEVGALTGGSDAAYSAYLANRRGDEAADVKDYLRLILEQAKRQEETEKKFGRELIEALRAGPGGVEIPK